MYFLPADRISDRHRHKCHSAKGRPSHDYSRSTNKTEVSILWKQECEIHAVIYQYRRMDGQDSGSPDGEDLGKEVCGVWTRISGV